MQRSTGSVDRRRLRRDCVLKRAQIIAGGGVFDCFVLDRSAAGVRVTLPAPVALPEHVTLRLDDSGGTPAWSRWSRGLETGLEFGPAP